MPLVRFAARLAAGILIAPAALGAGPDPAAALAAALPTVVRVDVVKRAPAAPAKSDFMEQIDRLLERPDRRTPDPRSESGSGFVLDPAAGLVVAADFVVRDAETISVLRHDGGVVVPELVAMDEETQLALLRTAGRPAGSRVGGFRSPATRRCRVRGGSPVRAGPAGHGRDPLGDDRAG